MKTEYFIYSILVDAPDRTLVKLGRAASLRQRISEIQTGCPYDIRRVVACDVLDEYEGGMREAQMHELYGQHRLRGEWFDPWGRIATEIDVEGLISDLRDVAAERLQDSVRIVSMTPYIDSVGKRRMQTKYLAGCDLPKLTDEDGYPINAPYRVGDVRDPVTVVMKRPRRLFRRH